MAVTARATSTAFSQPGASRTSGFCLQNPYQRFCGSDVRQQVHTSRVVAHLRGISRGFCTPEGFRRVKRIKAQPLTLQEIFLRRVFLKGEGRFVLRGSWNVNTVFRSSICSDFFLAYALYHCKKTPKTFPSF